MVARFDQIDKSRMWLANKSKSRAFCSLLVGPAVVLSLSVLSAQGQSLQNMPGQIFDSNQASYPPNPAGGSVGANIWANAAKSRVPIGTLLNGVLEDDLSSAKSHRGDVFSIRLEDGYFNNGIEVVPRHSRILGAVIFVSPSLINGHGHPGNLQVNLQTIVFPDGRNTPIAGFLVHNPNMDEVSNPSKSSASSAFMHYPSATAGSFAILGRSLSNRLIGYKPVPRVKGEDFKMVKGEILAVRLNRSLDLTHMSPPPTGFAPSNLANPDLNAPTVNGLSSGQPLLPTARPTAGAVPGQSISTPSWGGKQAPNPNQIFENPVGPKPGLNMPDPF